MNRRLRTTLTSASLATLAFGLTGCAPATTARGPGLPSPGVNSQTPRPGNTAAGSGVNDDPAGSPGPTSDPWEPTRLPILTQIFLGNAPTGSGPTIALRFLRALQRGDDLAADRELYQMGRDLIARHDLTFLHAVMNDVRVHAKLAHTGPCARAQQLNRESAVVSCGHQHVVVHVLHDQWGSGVQIAGWHTHHDVYRGPHSHAYTTINPWKS
jgi:hypothetical protein